MKFLRIPAFLAAAVFLPWNAPAADIDIPPTVVLGGGTNSDNYTLTASGQVQGSGTFEGTFNAQTHDLSVNTLAGDMIFNGAISGTASSPLPNLTVVAGSHTVHLNASNSFTGDVFLESGTLKLGNVSALGSGSGQFRTTLGAAVLDLNGQSVASENALIEAATTITNSSATAASWGGAIGISGANLTFSTAAGDIAVGGAISGGGVIKRGSGTLAVSGDNSGLTSAWDLVQGTLKFGHTNAAGVGVLIAGAGTTVDLAGQSMAVAGIMSSGNSFTIANSSGAAAAWNGNITNSATGTVTLQTTSGNLAINGAIIQSSGTTSLSIAGTGTTTLASSNSTFTGNITVAENSSLELADGGRIIFVIGASGTNNMIGGAGNVSFSGDFLFNLTGAGTTEGNSWTIVDVSSLNTTGYGGTFEVFGFDNIGSGKWEKNNFGTTYQFSQATGQLSVVPEPSALALAAAGGLLLAALRLRRRAN